jgi:class 3 adenylate cyclase
MRETLERLNEGFEQRCESSWRPDEINTGTVAGKGLVPIAFVAGDAANSAARLSSTQSGEILLAESTFRLVRASRSTPSRCRWS